MPAMSEADAEQDKTERIVRQLEYYFGDINLSKDKFMQEQAKQDDGWFTLETMLKFKRLLSVAENAENIVAALKSQPSELLELNEDSTKLRRRKDKPTPESFRDAIQQHKDAAVYGKGFPADSTLDEVQAYLEQFGRTLHIQMRKDVNTKKFKGSVYATYETKEGADAFLKATDKKFRDSVELPVRMTREEHFAQRKEKRKQEKEEAAKRRAETDAKRQEQRQQAERERLLAKMVRGSLLLLEGVSEPATKEEQTALFQELRAALGKEFGNENYLDFYDSKLYARFKEENSAAPAWSKIQAAHGDDGVVFRGNKLSGSVPTGEEEERVWGLVMRARQQHYAGGRGGRGGFRGGRGGGFRGRGGRGGGRRNRDNDGEPPAKRRRDDE